MIRLLPKRHLEWKEPKAVCVAREQVEAESRSPWIRPGALLVVVALCMANWWLALHNPTKKPVSLPVALCLTAGFGVFLVYVVPWFLHFLPSHISIFDKSIARVIGNSATSWQFKNIHHCEIVSIAIGARAEPALLIHPVKGRRSIIGVPADLVPKVTDVLCGLNVRIEQGEQLSLLSDLLNQQQVRWTP